MEIRVIWKLFFITSEHSIRCETISFDLVAKTKTGWINRRMRREKNIKTNESNDYYFWLRCDLHKLCERPKQMWQIGPTAGWMLIAEIGSIRMAEEIVPRFKYPVIHSVQRQFAATLISFLLSVFLFVVVILFERICMHATRSNRFIGVCSHEDLKLSETFFFFRFRCSTFFFAFHFMRFLPLSGHNAIGIISWLLLRDKKLQWKICRRWIFERKIDNRLD